MDGLEAAENRGSAIPTNHTAKAHPVVKASPQIGAPTLKVYS